MTVTLVAILNLQRPGYSEVAGKIVKYVNSIKITKIPKRCVLEVNHTSLEPHQPCACACACECACACVRVRACVRAR